MAYTVRDYMNKPVIVVDPETPVASALSIMKRRGIHSLVVDLTEGAKIAYGIITTTDIRDKIAMAKRDPAATNVGEIMTTPVHAASPRWTLQQCAEEMYTLGIHHMPVLDDDGLAVGMISATDIFSAVEEAGWESLG
ncbi:MAG: Inosine-5'-monophosphate dehydrogenase [Anaerolineae bacterium]|nr:Inosine-5'-monophosphate dehydrogenase [Anaerolineae bacterium]MDL1897760.1 CBS domain-containing protein [Anaerolineae bacterium CFX7]RIK29819.1 MAG: histidine kinase [Chloroflexota bacterium]